MTPTAWAALYCLFVWWFSTGLIVFLNNLPPRTFRWSFSAFTLVAVVSFYRLAAGSHDTSLAGAYAAFTYAVLVWGWHEMAFFMGFLTGPRKTASPPSATTWQRFGFGAAACIDHELAILATGIAVMWATWGAPNHFGLWTFMILWGMRLSAKLNVFLGVRNLGEAFLPAHLSYLLSFMAHRRMNWLMPASLAGGTALAAWLVLRMSVPGTTPAQSAGLVFLLGMTVLAVLEHAMLVLPLPFTALWSWWLRTSAGEPDTSASLAAGPSGSFTTSRWGGRRGGWPASRRAGFAAKTRGGFALGTPGQATARAQATHERPNARTSTSTSAGPNQAPRASCLPIAMLHTPRSLRRLRRPRISPGFWHPAHFGHPVLGGEQ